jgi:hypothetical protein
MNTPRIVTVTFKNIPDGNRSVGWLCWFGGEDDYADGDPMGRGATIKETFGFMLEEIAACVIEKTAFDRGRQGKPT